MKFLFIINFPLHVLNLSYSFRNFKKWTGKGSFWFALIKKNINTKNINVQGLTALNLSEQKFNSNQKHRDSLGTLRNFK